VITRNLKWNQAIFAALEPELVDRDVPRRHFVETLQLDGVAHDPWFGHESQGSRLEPWPSITLAWLASSSAISSSVAKARPG
jgi:hypothetical protein